MVGNHSILRAEQVKNSNWIQLFFNNEEERKKLESAVSFEVPGAQWSASAQSGLWNSKRCFLTKANRMRAGNFKAIFREHPLVFNKEHSLLTFDDIPLFNNNAYERRDYQIDAINAIFKEKFGILNCIMGSGKTMMAAGAISWHLKQNPKNKILFVVYDLNILNQSADNFTKYGFKVSKFGGGERDISGDIIIGTIQSLANLKDPKSVLKNITFLFLDEAHHGKAKTSRTVLNKLPNCQYRIGLTATPQKEKTLELADLQSVIGPVIFEYSFSTAVNAGSICPVKCFFLDLPINETIEDSLIFRRNYKVIWDTAISLNEKRNETIATILSSLITLLNTSNIVLTDRVLHGQELANSLKKYKNINFTQMYGEDCIALRELKREQLQTMEINSIISSVLNEGVDIKISPVVAINASGRKSFIKLIQFLGRITRKNERFGDFRCYLDFIDHDHKFVENHSYERVKACQEFGCEVVVVKSINELLTEIIKYYKLTRNQS